MAMKISTDKFKERVDKGIHDDFMRGAVARGTGRHGHENEESQLRN